MAIARVTSLTALALVTSFGLTACSGVSDSMSMSSLFGSSKPQQPAGEVADEFKARPSCPDAEIRTGAEAVQFYENGKSGDASSVRYQASVQRVARECEINDVEVVVKIGVAGRVAAGPKGGAGVVQVPLRIAVTGANNQLIYSKLHVVPVNVEAPDFSALWSEVDDQVRIPRAQSGDATIFVGLDEQGAKSAPQKSKKKG